MHIFIALMLFVVNSLVNNIQDQSFSPRDLTPNRPIMINGVVPVVMASSSLALDLSSNYQLYGQDTATARPLASITKLMTALVFLEHNPGWDQVYKIQPSDQRLGGRARLFSGEEITVKDLFMDALVASDNVAIIALINSSNISENDFVNLMNQKAQTLGLANTKFFDPTGLDSRNVASAGDIAKLAQAALANPDIRRAVLTKVYTFTTKNNRVKEIESTDLLLNAALPDNIKLLGGKTGYLDEAGYCFVGLFEKNNHEVVAVILGAASNEARFVEMKKLISAVYNNYQYE